MRTLHLALIHYPILDREGALVTTAMTNLDLHDMSRSGRTYGCASLFIVHPVAAQRELATRIVGHWIDGSGKKRIPARAVALAIARVTPSLDDMIGELGGRDAVELWATAAASRERAVSTFSAAREALAGEGKDVVLMFGTGWGLAPTVLDQADRLLEPIHAQAATGYNHLSVRAACAISLDRLRG